MITFIAGLIAGIITAIAGAYIVHFLTHDRAWREFRLHKLEELFTTIHNYEISVAEYYSRAAFFLNTPEGDESVDKQNEALENIYLKDLREEEKKSAIIPMIIRIYFKDLLPQWRLILNARHNLTNENKRAIILDKKQFAMTAQYQRNLLSGDVAIKLLKVHLPLLQTCTDEMFNKIIQAADLIKNENPWPFNFIASYKASMKTKKVE